MAYFRNDREEQIRGYDPRFRPEEYGAENAPLRGEDRSAGREPVREEDPETGYTDDVWYDADYDADYEDGFDTGYDDGFDELASREEEEELSEEERQEENRRRFRIAAGAGDLAAVLAGVAVILVLAAFLVNMIQFVSSDVAQNFSLWATKF